MYSLSLPSFCSAKQSGKSNAGFTRLVWLREWLGLVHSSKTELKHPSPPLIFTQAKTTDTLSKPASAGPAAFHPLLSFCASQWESEKQQGFILCPPH